MMFWILTAVMTAGAALAVLVPLNRRGADNDAQLDERLADAAVYRQQLAEIDRDLERGLIDAAAAEAARTEVARRLLSTDERKGHMPPAAGGRLRKQLVTLIAILALPAGTFALYLYTGSPNMPDLPLQARLSAPPENQSVGELIARVERHLSENPQDGQGWSVVAPVYMRVGNPGAAANAYANAIRLLGPSAQLLTDYGEALTMANEGIITADAHEAFASAVQMDPASVKPRFFLALALGQEGKNEDAIAAWSSLLEGADPAEPWVPVAQAELSRLGGSQIAGRLGAADDAKAVADGETAPPGPTAEEVAAARDMAADDRAAMIEGMVEGLAQRLETDGGTVDEWLRLIRAYAVLGKRDAAIAAIAKARDIHADDAQAMEQIDQLAEQAGLKGS